MAAISIISKGRRLYRREGLRGLLAAAFRKLYDRHQSVWYDRTLDDMELIKPHFEGRLDFDNPEKVIDWINSLKISGINDPIEIEKMKERGHLFVGIMNGADIIGYIKIGWDKVYVLDYRLDMQIPPSECFYIDLFVAPESRGLGAGPFIVSACMIEMRKRGFTGSIMHVRTDKTPMLKSA
ncbi:MAG: GNAT family N-acetyltransferase, partial [FCB group bacterium]|nr:GNAT family N-acetyltransferase [FCB group bacterium]